MGSGMTQTRFPAARAKLCRARRHLHELSEAIAAYKDSHPIRMILPTADEVAKGAPSSGYFDTPDVPEMTAEIIGDIVHNARASLDLMVSELALARGKSTNNVAFPFGENEQDFERQIQRKNLHRCGKGAMEVVRRLRPYKTGNRKLRAVHDLDIMDKHRQLLPLPRIDATIEITTVSRKGEPPRLVKQDVIEYDYSFAEVEDIKGELIACCEEIIIICEGVVDEMENFLADGSVED